MLPTNTSTYTFSAPAVGDEAPTNSAEVIKAVNGANATWTSGVNERFAGFTLGDMRMLMGAKPEDMSKLPKMEPYDAATLAAVPASYDPRTSQKACTGPVLDQGFCGSCWAFGATEAISDRLCLSKGAGASFVQLAPLDLTTCDSGVFKMEDGCQGGQLSGAWDYAKKTGLVEESCYPYLQSQGGPVPTCEPTAQPCLPESKFIKTPKCAISSTCEATKHKLSSVYSVDVAQLKAELVNKGPVESAFTVYADFPTYKSGVYKHTTGSALGGHAIKIIGFGTEDNSNYCMPHALATPRLADRTSLMLLGLGLLCHSRVRASPPEQGSCKTRGRPRGATAATSRSPPATTSAASRASSSRASSDLGLSTTHGPAGRVFTQGSILLYCLESFGPYGRLKELLLHHTQAHSA